MRKLVLFAVSIYTLIKPFGSKMKSSCLSYQKDKKNKDCGHTRHFHSCYETNCYILTKHSVMCPSKSLRNLSFQVLTCVLYYSKKICSVECFKVAIISPLCSSHNYLNRHLSCIRKIWKWKFRMKIITI